MGISVPKPKHKRLKPTWGARSEFSNRVRNQIRERDNDECQMCGSHVGLQIHHVKGRGQGGRGVYTNGVLLCWICHQNVQTHQRLINEWQRKFEERYGANYYKDQWDEGA
ncbi:HNH endonuclease [Sporolactobacillus kofuensis]|uniref:HNH endonuclease n=1 Tax=Sporolactobacillus kofuensis TaxID=269672 RepID=A0ABW1WCC7_9BACL|nr:HNH endonuclease [Sporolactobacillus kofuensis]MCO7177043.1 HNH endonuclease [Sporolactobacillus kofuensis]